ncbi:MAG: class I SAM-dependent methyltransferase, partial [Acidimicrobiales bacterium]
MISDEHQIRALSFGGVADLYERARPGYPDDAVAWMTGGTPIRVLDLGAGTGKLTRSLAEAGHDVVAVPSQAMLAQLQATLPASRHSRAAPSRSRCPTRRSMSSPWP